MDSGSAVTAVSGAFQKTRMGAGAPVGELRPTTRSLRGANGSQIDILGCSFCVVSFQGLRTEFPILVCDLSTDAIIGTDQYYHTHWTSNMECCLRKEACPFSYTAGMLHYPDVCLPWDIARFHRILRQFFTVLLAPWVASRCRPVGCWKA